MAAPRGSQLTLDDAQRSLVRALLTVLAAFQPTAANNRLDDTQADLLSTAIEELLQKLNYRSGQCHALDEALFYCGLDTTKAIFSVALYEPLALTNQLQAVLEAFDIVGAARTGDEDKVLAFLTKHPMYRDQSLPSGHAVLCVAARAGHYGLVRKLIDEQKCSVNIQNVLDHKTALHYCVERPAADLNFELIAYLLRRKADLFLVCKPGTAEASTPFSLALAAKHERGAELVACLIASETHADGWEFLAADGKWTACEQEEALSLESALRLDNLETQFVDRASKTSPIISMAQLCRYNKANANPDVWLRKRADPGTRQVKWQRKGGDGKWVILNLVDIYDSINIRDYVAGKNSDIRWTPFTGLDISGTEEVPSDDEDNVGGARASNVPRYRPAASPDAIAAWKADKANEGKVAVPLPANVHGSAAVAIVQERLADDEDIGAKVGAAEVNGTVLLLGKKEDVERANTLLSLPRVKKERVPAPPITVVDDEAPVPAAPSEEEDLGTLRPPVAQPDVLPSMDPRPRPGTPSCGPHAGGGVLPSTDGRPNRPGSIHGAGGGGADAYVLPSVNPNQRKKPAAPSAAAVGADNQNGVLPSVNPALQKPSRLGGSSGGVNNTPASPALAPVLKKQVFQVPHVVPEGALLRHLSGFSNLLFAEDNSLTPSVLPSDVHHHNQPHDITVSGTMKHLRAASLVVQRLNTLAEILEGAPGFFERRLKQATQQINLEIHAVAFVPCPKPRWVKYATAVKALIEERTKVEKEELKGAVLTTSQHLISACIKNDPNVDWEAEMKEVTEKAVRESCINGVGMSALCKEAFTKMTDELAEEAKKKRSDLPRPSLAALDQSLAGLHEELAAMQPVKWCAIPALLCRALVYVSTFATGLPLFDSSRELMRLVRANRVISLHTGTGSGKSTLLPPLLFADGHKRIAVTQPRRLPCKLISKRVQDTCGAWISGWQVAGAAENNTAPVLYLTDGLLREMIVGGQQPAHDIVVLDEIHERGLNIDLCIALLAKAMKKFPTLRVILSTATPDPAVRAPFERAGFKVADFSVIPRELHKVEVHSTPTANPVGLAVELAAKLKVKEQLLVFLPSTRDVREASQLFTKLSGQTSEMLYAQQSASNQQLLIDTARVFFSTTVAETSLTFPCMRYVIDTGRINAPEYDSEKLASKLIELNAAESTRKQRKGRLGRVMEGDYYSLYDPALVVEKYPRPSLLCVDAADIELSLLRSSFLAGHSPLQGLTELDLPTPVPLNRLKDAQKRLMDLGFLTSTSPLKLSAHGELAAHLPVVGGARISACVIAALEKFNCGRDMLRLAAVLLAGEAAAGIIRACPQALRQEEGDMWTLKCLFDKLYTAVRRAPQTTNIGAECKRLGLASSCASALKRAVQAYRSIERAFEASPKLAHLKAASQQAGPSWEAMAKALLVGYSDQVFVSLAELHGPKPVFERLMVSAEPILGQLDASSSVSKKPSERPQELFIARDVMFTTHLQGRCLCSVAGKLDAKWMTHPLKRLVPITATEKGKLAAPHFGTLHQNIAAVLGKYPSVKVKFINKGADFVCEASGPAGAVIQLEFELHKTLRIADTTIDLTATQRGNVEAEKRLRAVMGMSRVFLPLCWRWGNLSQVEVKVQPQQCTVVIAGREEHVAKIRDEFKSFAGWLSTCSVVRSPDAGRFPQRIHDHSSDSRGLDPTRLKEMRARIKRVTDAERSPLDLLEATVGPKATRETRMEVVAWIAVCEFSCKAEGGFVRDWIVGGYNNHPASGPATWLQTKVGRGGIPHSALDPMVVPADVDLHLPSDAMFSIDKFVDALVKRRLIVDKEEDVERDSWRYTLIIDRDAPTGPFTVELIEPHIVITHDMIDFDVSNLYVLAGYTQELGMRVDVTVKPFCITLEKLVDNIHKKQFQTMRAVDGLMAERVEKMKKRGWTQAGTVLYRPPNPAQAIQMDLPTDSDVFRDYSKKLSHIGRVKRIQQISNQRLIDLYASMKATIEQELKGDANERVLYHGTGAGGVNGIPDAGFDDRFCSAGFFGMGMYFAEDPAKSHQYTESNGDRTLFVVKVTLGRQQALVENGTTRQLTRAEKGFHSVRGTHNSTNPNLQYVEHIVYRFGQAYPDLKITYQ